VARRRAPLWTCDTCGRGFANRNQTHACGRYSLRHHFDNKPAAVYQLFRAFVRELKHIGPVIVLPEKTRIAFQVRMSFAQVTPRRTGLVGHLVLARRHPDPRFTAIDSISARNHVHHFRLQHVEDLDEAMVALLREAYAVGEQRHLGQRTQSRSSS
jgi:hypothetical protein